MLRQRRPAGEEPDPCSGSGDLGHAAASEPGVFKQGEEPSFASQPGEQHSLLKTHTARAAEVDGMSWAERNHWIVLAVASGACAAFNGVFAKLYVVPKEESCSRSFVYGWADWLTIG